jgi:polyphosphate kinase 2 (PPK2 family)
MDADKGQSTNKQPSLEDRVRDELEDNLDEELELELGDDFLARLPDSVADMPSTDSIDRRRYFTELLRLQRELIKLQDWVVDQKLKLVVLFEGRDAAGKGGVIKRVTQRLNPRICRTVALPAPSERERTQWYFQRYICHLPAAGGRRDRVVRPQLVQSRRCRARDGFLRRGRSRGILPHRP